MKKTKTSPKSTTKNENSRPPKPSKLLEMPASTRGGKQKAPTPARGGPPEVMVDSGTTLVLPNPANAPPPPKAVGRKKKAASTVATRSEAIPPAEVPDWAKRAAARDTTAEMAAVPEVAPASAATPSAPPAKKGRVAKASMANTVATADGTTKPGSLRAIGNGWIESLRAVGHSVSTVRSYGNDLEVAYEFLDGNSAAADLTEKQIAKFNVSALVLNKKNGKAKAQPTILKTRRALRLALVWAEQKGLIKKAPIAAKTPA